MNGMNGVEQHTLSTQALSFLQVISIMLYNRDRITRNDTDLQVKRYQYTTVSVRQYIHLLTPNVPNFNIVHSKQNLKLINSASK